MITKFLAVIAPVVVLTGCLQTEQHYPSDNPNSEGCVRVSTAQSAAIVEQSIYLPVGQAAVNTTGDAKYTVPAPEPVKPPCKPKLPICEEGKVCDVVVDPNNPNPPTNPPPTNPPTSTGGGTSTATAGGGTGTAGATQSTQTTNAQASTTTGTGAADATQGNQTSVVSVGSPGGPTATATQGTQTSTLPTIP